MHSTVHMIRLPDVILNKISEMPAPELLARDRKFSETLATCR
jgi:hypothetical protein